MAVCFREVVNISFSCIKYGCTSNINVLWSHLCTEVYFLPLPPTVLDAEEQQHVAQLLIYLLPACNSDTLHRLLEFLSTVTDHAHDKQDKDGQEVGLRFYLRDIKVIHQL